MKVTLCIISCILNILSQNANARIIAHADDVETVIYNRYKDTNLLDLNIPKQVIGSDSLLSQSVFSVYSRVNKQTLEHINKKITKRLPNSKIIDSVKPNSKDQETEERWKRETDVENNNEVDLGYRMEDELPTENESLENDNSVLGRRQNTVDKNKQGDSDDTKKTVSIENETVEDDIPLNNRRNGKEKKRVFKDVYRYENQSLKNMLLWLVLNSQNPAVKNAVKVSKASVDKYVKQTVEKAGIQAALRYNDYTTLRFDKDRILIYCGGQVHVYTTFRDSKICFNGQMYEIRLI